MINIYYANVDKTKTNDFLLYTTKKFYNKQYSLNDIIVKDNKIIVGDFNLSFSITHTKNAVFIAFIDKGNIGIDAETIRDVSLNKLNGKFFGKQPENVKDFYKLITTAEAFIKYSNTENVQLKDITIDGAHLSYKGIEQSLFINSQEIENNICTVITSSNNQIIVEKCIDFE